MQVRLHMFFLLFAAFTMFLSRTQSGFGDNTTWMAAAAIVILLASVLLHELGHYFTAVNGGGDAQLLVLWPLGGLCPIQPPLDPRQADPFVIREDAISFLNQRGHRLSAEFRYDVTDNIELRALTSWQDGYTRDQTDGDRGLAPAVPANLPTSGANTARF